MVFNVNLERQCVLFWKLWLLYVILKIEIISCTIFPVYAFSVYSCSQKARAYYNSYSKNFTDKSKGLKLDIVYRHIITDEGLYFVLEILIGRVGKMIPHLISPKKYEYSKRDMIAENREDK
jgi:hypothetical protein